MKSPLFFPAFWGADEKILRKDMKDHQPFIDAPRSKDCCGEDSASGNLSLISEHVQIMRRHEFTRLVQRYGLY